MCLGLPMKVLQADEFSAVVEGRGQRREVSLLLTGPVAVGRSVLVMDSNAQRVLEDDEVPLINDALDALEKSLKGEAFDGHFADLERPPELPPHLRPPGEKR